MAEICIETTLRRITAKSPLRRRTRGKWTFRLAIAVAGLIIPKPRCSRIDLNLNLDDLHHVAVLVRQCYSAFMRLGRLVRVGRYQGDRKAVGYIVAMPDEDAALDLMRIKIAGPLDYVEDVAPVSEALLVALKLSLGQYVRTCDAAPSLSPE